MNMILILYLGFINLRLKTTQAHLSLMGSKGLDDHRTAVSVVYTSQLVYSQGQAPEKRENREKIRERERLTYRSGPQGKPDPAGILTCLISMSSTQPDKTISCSSLHFSFSLTFGLYINFRGQKNCFSFTFNQRCLPFLPFSFSLWNKNTHNIYQPQGCRDPQISAALLRCLCILRV